MHSMVFMKKIVVVIIEHTLPCNVPGIRHTSIRTQQGLRFAHRDYVTTVDGRRPQPSAEKLPVRGAGRKRWRLEIQNMYAAVVPGTRISGTRCVVPGTRYF